MTPDDLKKAEQRFQRAYARCEEAREHRNAKIRSAIAEGHTHKWISDATGLTRGRVGQISLAGTDAEAEAVEA